MQRTARRAAADLYGIDIAPDGRGFMILTTDDPSVQPGGAQTGLVDVVINWATTLPESSR